jgi:hypothetical protein
LSENQYFAKSLGLGLEELQGHLDIALSSRNRQYIDSMPSQAPEKQAAPEPPTTYEQGLEEVISTLQHYLDIRGELSFDEVHHYVDLLGMELSELDGHLDIRPDVPSESEYTDSSPEERHFTPWLSEEVQAEEANLSSPEFSPNRGELSATEEEKSQDEPCHLALLSTEEHNSSPGGPSSSDDEQSRKMILNLQDPGMEVRNIISGNARNSSSQGHQQAPVGNTTNPPNLATTHAAKGIVGYFSPSLQRTGSTASAISAGGSSSTNTSVDDTSTVEPEPEIPLTSASPEPLGRPVINLKESVGLKPSTNSEPEIQSYQNPQSRWGIRATICKSSFAWIF